jgi:hypothetical protein
MIRTTPAQRAAIRQQLSPDICWRNEDIWTCLVADILDTATDQRPYLAMLCGGSVACTQKLEPWFEAQPMAPRKGTPLVDNESNTKIDLAIGAIRQRGKSGSGIEFAISAPQPWVCFVEGKGPIRDCDFMTEYDLLRNQLERDIESLLYFQYPGRFPDRLFFTLLTPRRFKENPRSRLYGYRMTEYLANRNLIIADIERCTIPRRDDGNHEYPLLRGRLDRLTLNWVAYEDILESALGVSSIDMLDPGQIPGLTDWFQRLATALAGGEHTAVAETQGA